MRKLYFESADSEMCYPLEYFRNKYKDEMNYELYEAVKDKLDSDIFWCYEFAEFGETGTCGKVCPRYEPCNGKSGKCKHYSKIGYVHGEKITIKFLMSEETE